MSTTEMLAAIDEELERLTRVRNLLAGGGGFLDPFGDRPRKKHKMSAEGRARIAAAQKKRWAKQKATR